MPGGAFVAHTYPPTLPTYDTAQALSHCVNFSTRDLIGAWPPQRYARPRLPSKSSPSNNRLIALPTHTNNRRGDLSLLRAMSSPVAGFERQAQEFVDFLKASGVGVEG